MGRKAKPCSLKVLGDVAQLAEHLLCKQGVVGSNPIVSTVKAQVRAPGLSLCLNGDCRRSQFERSLSVDGYVWGFVMASRPTVRWNESAGRWMAWVRFPDGSRRKVERVDKAAAQRDLDELVALRAQSLDPLPRRERLVSFAEVIEAWFEAGWPNGSPTPQCRHARAKLTD